MKPVVITLALFCAALARAALPEAVLQALLSPVLSDTLSRKSWQVTTPERWIGSPTRVSELGGITTSVQSGADHPDGWVRTELILTMPPRTDETPQPTQTFTVKALPLGVTPKTTLTFTFLNEAELPPCTVRTWQGFPALVAVSGDWYIIAQDAKARITQSHDTPMKTTLSVSDCTTEKTSPLSRSILIGEGPLPPEAPKN